MLYTINKVTKYSGDKLEWSLVDTAESASQVEFKALTLLNNESFLLTMRGNQYLALYWIDDFTGEVNRHYYQ